MSFFEDVSREVMGKRRELLPVKKNLEDGGASPKLVYPVKLLVT